MIRLFLVLALVSVPASAFAEEQDDLLARQLAAVVRDPRFLMPQRVEAAHSLSKLGPKATAALPELIAQVNRLKNRELEPLQEAVIEAIGSIGSPGRAALPALARASGRSIDIDMAIKQTTRDVLAAPDNQDLNLLVRQTQSADASVRLRAVKAISLLGRAGAYAKPALLGLLKDPDGDVRRATLSALRVVDPDGKASDDLVQALQLDLRDENAEVRLQAVRALGRLGVGAAKATAAIEALLADPDKDVRKAALETMQRILVP